MEQMDLFLFLLAGLSVLVGYVRGLSDEILRFISYVLSGILGCFLIPVFQPIFSIVPGEAAQRSLALFLGTVVVWFALKVVTTSLKQKVKESRFQKLDKSLGSVFGGVRIFAALIALNFVFEILSPRVVESSKILSLSGAGTSYVFDAFPEFENFKPKKIKTAEAQEWDWKKRLLYYLQNTTVGEGKEKTTLLSYIASKAVKEASEEKLSGAGEKASSEEQKKTGLSDLKKDPEINRVSAQEFERRMISMLKGEAVDSSQNEEEALGAMRKKLLLESMEKGASK